MRQRLMVLLMLVLAGAGLPLGSFSVAAAQTGVQSTTFHVTHTDDTDPPGACDPTDCSLREAVIAANAEPGPTTIVLQSGQTYQLSIPDTGPGPEVGPLKPSNATIQGNGATIQSLGSLVMRVPGSGSVGLDRLTITGGTASGGISNFGTLTVTSSTISGNSAGFEGGGIRNVGTLAITSSTISGNSAPSGGGGGIFNGGTLTITSSTISGNTAPFGGGIYNNLGTLTVTSSTISGNSASNVGGGIYNFNATPNLKSSIVAGNTAGGAADCDHSGSGSITSSGYNLFGSGTGCPAGSNDATAADPLLGTLADNGGPTATHALLTGSPAIDLHPASDTDCAHASTDQRGMPRPFPADGDCDAGAYESQTVQPPSAALLLSPQGSGHSPPITYTWQAAAGSSWYLLHVNRGNTTVINQWYTAQQAGCATGGTCTLAPPTSLQPGSYTWWILTWNTAGHGPWSAGMGFNVAAPAAATLIAPLGTGHNNPITYEWDAVSGSTWYYLWVNRGSTNVIKQWYTAEQANCPTGGTCSVTPATNLSAGDHTWWIQTWNPAGHGPWSAGMGFNVAAPAAATLIGPQGTGHNNPIQYEWNAVSGSTWYYLWVNRGSTNVIKRWYTADEVGCASGTGTCLITPSTNLSAGDHTWWIQTWSPEGHGPWSAGMGFNVN